MNTKSIENSISNEKLVHKDQLEMSDYVIDLCESVFPIKIGRSSNTFCIH